MKLSDLIPKNCPYCGKDIVHYDIHLRICEKYKKHTENKIQGDSKCHT